MRRMFMAAVVAISATACGHFSHEEVPVVFTNETRVKGTLSINSQNVLDFGPLGTARFTVEVDVARPRYDGYGTGPSSIGQQANRVTAIEVSVLNKDVAPNGARSRTQMCYAGAKITLSIIYRSSMFDPGGDVNCRTLDAYGNVMPEDKLREMAGLPPVEGGGSQ